MPRPRLATDTKKLHATARPVRERAAAVADPAEYQKIFVATLARWQQAERRLAETSGEAWEKSPLHQVLDRTGSLLIRLAPLMNFAVVVAQRPAGVPEVNPFRQFRAVGKG